MIQFEKYEGGRGRHICPNCGVAKQFTRYLNERGEPFADNVGICNRKGKCNYNYSPKQFFADNPARYPKKRVVRQGFIPRNVSENLSTQNLLPKQCSYISQDVLERTLTDYGQNTFVQFLLSLFPDDLETVQDAVQKYFVGSFEGKTVFWQVDGRGRVRTGKLMRFDTKTGKRQSVSSWIDRDTDERRELKTTWMHTELKREGSLSENFELNQCYFGEHLLPEYPDLTVIIVEAEKTAIIASLCFPEFLWLSCGGKQSLQVDGLKRFRGRKIILCPDADGFDKWSAIAQSARAAGIDVSISSLIDNHATGEQKANGYDLADYLIEEQTEINRLNHFADCYNTKLISVMNDESLFRQFETILDEQKAIRVIDGDLSDTEAEAQISNSENFRNIVLSL